MMMRYYHLTQHPRVFLKVTGLHISEFDNLMGDVQPAFTQAEPTRLEHADRQRAIGGGRDSELDGRNQVLLTVIWLRVYPTHEVLAYLFGVSDSTVSRVLQRVLPLVEQAGRDTMRLPDPGRKRRRSLPELLQDTPELAVVIDSLEQKVQRPQNQDERDGFYSGKKKTHTLKSQIAVDEETGCIVDVSASVTGRTHDLTLLKQSGLLARLPEGIGSLGRLGLSGYPRFASAGGLSTQETLGQGQTAPTGRRRLQSGVLAASDHR